jgi:phosphonopyruvate decarboxylase
LASASRQLVDLLDDRGFDFFTGVPCSFFAGVLRILASEPRYGYIGAVREDCALGLAAGAYLGGRQPVVFMQNSGLGVSVNAIVSLNQIYDIPALLVVSWRGQRASDAPEHLIMGAMMEDFLRLLRIPFKVFERATIARDVARLTDTMRSTHKPVALIVLEGQLQQ